MSLREIKIEKIEDLNNFTWNTEFGKQIIICYKGEAYISSLGKLNVISDTECVFNINSLKKAKPWGLDIKIKESE